MLPLNFVKMMKVILVITIPQRSFGMVMFSQASVFPIGWVGVGNIKYIMAYVTWQVPTKPIRPGVTSGGGN